MAQHYSPGGSTMQYAKILLP